MSPNILRNDRFYRAIGVLTINISYLKNMWYLVYYNNVHNTYDETIKNITFSRFLDQIKDEVKAKIYINPNCKEKLLDLISKSKILNKRRNEIIHASIFGHSDKFYIERKRDKKLCFEDLNDDNVKEIEDLGVETAALRQEISQIPYNKEKWQ